MCARAEPAFFQARVAPILDRHCVTCHGAEKQKGGMRLDTFEAAMKGGDDGAVIKPGDAKGSDMIRRLRLARDDEEAMPSDGKPALSADEIKIIELWISAGASETQLLSAFPDAPEPRPPAPVGEPLTPDWQPRAAQLAALEAALGVRFVPRSESPTDGLILRTASAPVRCDDAALARLGPVADLIVEAELGRTKVTDAGLAALAAFTNLRLLDLTRTAVTSRGVAALRGLQKLESLNLTNTAVDAGGAASLKALPALRRVWLFGTPAEEAAMEPAAAK